MFSKKVSIKIPQEFLVSLTQSCPMAGVQLPAMLEIRLFYSVCSDWLWGLLNLLLNGNEAGY
jgi:hypothetical protein